MTKLTFVLCSLFALSVQAFVQPSAQVRSLNQATVFTGAEASSMALNAEDTYWEGEYPPSKVLGPLLSKMPSGMLGLISIVFLATCVVSVAQSNVLAQAPGAVASGEWVKWYYVLGSFMGP